MTFEHWHLTIDGFYMTVDIWHLTVEHKQITIYSWYITVESGQLTMAIEMTINNFNENQLRQVAMRTKNM